VLGCLDALIDAVFSAFLDVPYLFFMFETFLIQESSLCTHLKMGLNLVFIKKHKAIT